MHAGKTSAMKLVLEEGKPPSLLIFYHWKRNHPTGNGERLRVMVTFGSYG